MPLAAAKALEVGGLGSEPSAAEGTGAAAALVAEATAVAKPRGLSQQQLILQENAATVEAVRDGDQLRRRLETAQAEAAGKARDGEGLRQQLKMAQAEAAEKARCMDQLQRQLDNTQAEAVKAAGDAARLGQQLATAQKDLSPLAEDPCKLLEHLGTWFQQQGAKTQQLQEEIKGLGMQRMTALASLMGVHLPAGLLGPQQQGQQEREGEGPQEGVAGSDGVGKALQLLGDEAVKVKGEVEKLQQRKRGVLGVVVPGTCHPV